jgi:hypothetical protein
MPEGAPLLCITAIAYIPLRPHHRGITPRRFVPGINSIYASNPTSLHLEDNSTKKLQFTKFLKFKSHYFASLIFSECH